MSNITVSLKNLAEATVDTFKKKPAESLIKLAAIVSAVALTALVFYLLGPIAPLAIVITIAAFYLLPPTFLAYLLFDDIKDSLFMQYRKDHSLDKVNDQDLVLVLEGNNDHNGVFQVDQRKQFQKIEKKYALAFQTVNNLEEVSSSIERAHEQNNRIKAIWFRAHGNPTGFNLSPDEDLDLDNAFTLKHHFDLMESDGVIVLDSCATAGNNPDPKKPNIAQELAQLVQGRTVIAPAENIISLSLKVDKKNPLRVKFWIPLKPAEGRLKKGPTEMINMVKMSCFKASPKRFKNCARDTTQVYQVN